MEATHNYALKRYLYFWAAWGVSYVFPFTYFFVKLGFTKSSTSIVLPTLFIGILGIIKLASSIPKWVSTWKPSYMKGLVQAIPKVLLFFVLITLGLTLQVILERQIYLGFTAYYETVIVLFGGVAAGSLIEAVHLKYQELDMIDKGYVLGVVNK